MIAILQNPIVSGGLLLMASGAAIAVLRKVPESLWDLFKKRILYTVEIEGNDSAYAWVKAWLGTKAKSRYVGAGTAPRISLDGSIPQGQPPTFHSFPLGASTFKYHGKRILAWSSRDAVSGTTVFRESIRFQCWGSGENLVQSILKDSYDLVTGNEGQTVEVWIPDGSSWRLADRKSVRPAATLCLASGIHEAIIDDAKDFIARRKWYLSMGIPFRRGYLLYGPPGNGKSSLAHALASELKVNINVANISSFPSDSAMLDCLGKVPRGHIVLLEDIDAAFVNRNASDKISFSGLLNALDGVTAQEGRILMMTTNHLENLDPALIRPGRADVKLFVGNATPSQAKAIYTRFFPTAESGNADIFASRVGDVSMARLQEYLIQHRNDCNAALADADEVGAMVVRPQIAAG